MNAEIAVCALEISGCTSQLPTACYEEHLFHTINYTANFVPVRQHSFDRLWDGVECWLEKGALCLGGSISDTINKPIAQVI